MASSWIRRRKTKSGQRFHVKYRLGGRAFPELHGGAFDTQREARERKRFIDGEIAAGRAPDLGAIARDAEPALTLALAAETWRESRLDVSDSTRVIHRVSLGRLLPHLGERPLDELTSTEVAEWVAMLHRNGYARGTIAKSLTALRQILDYFDVEPNVARDRRVKLPREDRDEISPPTAKHVEAVLGAVAPRYRLPVLILEATGMRVGELETLSWADIDESKRRWRVSQASSKTRRARWIQVPGELFSAVLELVPREDRRPSALVLPDLTQERLRTDIRRACKATGTPLLSPHDLRHRRISLWHREGVSWADVGQRVGQRNLAVTANTYTHVLLEGEVDWASHL